MTAAVDGAPTVAIAGPSIGEVFARVAAAHPDRLAFEHAGREWSYRALDRAANALAHALGAVLPDPQQRVALLLDDRAHQLVAMLGVLKAGHVYVPLSSADPHVRLGARIEHAQAGAIVVASATCAIAHLLAGELPQLVIDTLEPDGRDQAPPAVVALPDLACLFYTSGSTGTPKGVLQTHGNILHHVAKYSGSVGIGPADRLTWLPDYVHAASISDVFPALLNGATLLPYSVAAQGLGELGPWLRAQRATIYHSVPTIVRQLVAHTPAAAAYPDLRLVRLAGEPLRPADLAACRGLFAPHCRVLNSLGMTEINLVRQLFVAPEADYQGASVPVGYAVADTDVVVLDAHGAEAARGAPGQIAVRSRHLSPGYWRDPELTRQRFVPDPADPGLRTFLTGDLGRMAPDGCLTHLGRDDRRVKLHGHSIDLQDIEAALAPLTPCTDLAVVDAAGPDGGDDRWLVAFLAGCPPRGVDTAALRAGLAHALPAHMASLRFVCLEALPQTTTGKVDRAALRELAARTPVHRRTPWAAPGDHATFTLARMWEELLDFRPVGLHDDFFELGGDSLLALRMLAQLGQLYGRTVSPLAFVRQPSVAGLARLLRAEAATADPVTAVALKAGDGRPPLFFVPGGAGSEFEIAFIYRDLVERLGAGQAVYGLAARNLDPDFGNAGVEALAGAFENALHAVAPAGPYFLAGECIGGIVAFELARRLEQRGEQVAFLALLDTDRPGAALAWRRHVQRLHAHLARRAAAARVVIGRAVHHLRQLGRRPPREAWRYLREKLGSARQMREENRNTAAIVRDQVRHYHAVYRYRRPQPCRATITLIVSEDGDRARAAAAWRGLAGGIDAHAVPGDHESYIRARVETTAACLRSCLEAAQAVAARERSGARQRGHAHRPATALPESG